MVRILQEQGGDKFKPCAGGVFERNLVVFNAKVRTFVNVGPNTAPKSFVFRENAWFEVGGKRKPRLPVAEKGGVYGVDPGLDKPGTAEMKATEPRLKGYGADAYRPPKAAPQPGPAR